MRKSTFVSKAIRGFADLLNVICSVLVCIAIPIIWGPIVWIENIGRSCYRPIDALEIVCAILDLIPSVVCIFIGIPLSIYEVSNDRTDEEIDNLTVGEIKRIVRNVAHKVYARATLRGRFLKATIGFGE